MIYLKTFETIADYNAAKDNLFLPNASFITDSSEVRYIKQITISDAVISCDSATYDGTNHVATNIVVTLTGTTLVENTDYVVSSNTGGTNAGNYVITISGIGRYTGSKDGTFTINKVTPTVVVPTAKVLTYNGSAQELVNAGSTNFGTLKYSLDGTAYSTSIPTATNYGSYTVYYKVEGDSNINDVAPVTVNCSINEKQVIATVELSQDTYTYDGTAKQPIVTVKDGSTVIDPSEYSVAYSNNTNAGTATVTISDNVGGNYEVIGSATFTINKANPTYVAPIATSPTYDGTAHNLLNAGSTSDGTIQYSTDNSTWSTTIPTQTNAGTYTTYWRLVGDSNHNDVASASISTTISPKVVSNPTITLSPTSYTYNGSACEPTPTVEDDGVIINASEYTVSYSDNINAGTATVTITDNSNGNYTVNGSTTFTINKVTPTVVSPVPNVLTYNGSAQELVTAGSTNFGTLKYKVGSDSWSTSIPTRTRGGAYTVYYKVDGDSNINDVAEDTVACSINEKPVTAVVTVSPTSYTYNGSACEPTVTVKDGETIIDPSEYTVAYSNNTNAGTATVTIYDVVGGDYYVTGSTTFTIAKADQSAPTATGATTTYNTTATATASGGGGQGSIEWESAQSQTSVGSHTTRARWSGNSNYNASPWSSSVTVQMNKASQSAPTATGASVWQGSTATATASGGGGQGSLEWSNGNTRTALGSQSTSARWSGNGNYNASSWSNSVTLTVNDPYVGHAYVEIGGLKWATMNIGASSVTDAGLYFQWGDTQGYTASQVGSGSGKKYFYWKDYKYGNGKSSPGATGMTKYNSTDGKTVLDLSDDAARANWGGGWRMPTTAEFQALGNAVNTAWTNDYQGTSISGLVCTDKTDSSKVLFFPAAGYCFYGRVTDATHIGYYWSSSLHGNSVQNAYRLYFNSSDSYWDGGCFRYYGCPVRGVVG